MSYDSHYQEVRKVIRGKERVLLIPSNWLKSRQQALLPELRTLGVSPYCHAYVYGRNTQSCVAPHQNKPTIIALDLKEFFGSITPRQVFSALRGHRFSERKASEITALCTYHDTLPFGAPTSPIISNLVFWPCDMHIGISLHNLGFVYTRYADDLIISTDQQDIGYDAPIRMIENILLRYGFKLNETKTRVNPSRALGEPLSYPVALSVPA